MTSVSRLRATILAVLNSPDAQDGNQQFFEDLMSNKQALLSVFDVGARNQQQQRELENGRIVINGRPLAVNRDFARQVVFISEQLEVSEYHVAELLQDVMVSTPNVTGDKAIEATILEFHLRRRQVTDCLRYLFEATLVAHSSEAPYLYEQIQVFVKQHILARKDLSRSIFAEIQRLGDMVMKVRSALQNARSDTVLQPQQGGQLGSDVLTARHDSLQYERRNLATVFYLLARLGLLLPTEVMTLVTWLQKFAPTAMAYYFLPTVLASFDVVEPESSGDQARLLLATNEELIRYLKTTLAPSSEWTDVGLKSVILLKWTLFMTDTRHRNPDLEDKEGFRADDLENQIWTAVHGDCFLYAVRVIAMLYRKHGAYPPTSYGAAYLPKFDHESSAELPPENFRPAILESFETLLRLLIAHASSELRRIKQRQEDVLLANARSERTRQTPRVASNPVRHPGTAADSVPGGTARNDIAMLYSLIGLLYASLPPERALQFWGGGNIEGQPLTYLTRLESTTGKLPSFLQWAVWSTQQRDTEMTTALYDMLTGLANGQQCSELAYNFLARGGPEGAPANMGSPAPVSWIAIFGLLEQWQSAIALPRPQPQQQGLGLHPSLPNMQRVHHHQPFVLLQRDVLLAQSFLRLLGTVATNSVSVRLAISSHGRFRAIPSLASLIPLSIPLELKGAIFETLAAFSTPNAGHSGVEICRSIWTLLERYEIINVRGSLGVATAIPPVKGLEVEFEEVEVVHKLYPETIPFLQLLATLIHTPKNVQAENKVDDTEPVNTIPDALGHPYRQIGIGPYISFVVDHVLARISQREYLRTSDRWRMNDLCLCFVERCLASFELDTLVANPDDQATSPAALMHLAAHPGYDIMKRMLTQSSLQNIVLSYAVDGLDGFDRGYPEEQPYFVSTIVRVLRIILRVLEIQDIFLDVFIPLLSAIEDAGSVIGEVQPVSYYIRFDQSLFYGSDYIPSITAYIAYPQYPELLLLAVKILAALATPSTVSQLSAIVDRSGESNRILDGFLSIMDSENVSDVEEARQVAEMSTGAGAPDKEASADAIGQATKLAVLDFFVQNTQPDRPYPNIAHLLLFGKASVRDEIQDPAALGARRACVHSIIDLLNRGVPRIKTKGKRRRSGGILNQALLVAIPALAERCYQVIYQLCKHPRTSDFSMRYLRSREDFFARHFAAIPFKVPTSPPSSSSIEVLYGDGARVITTAADLCAFLRLRATIFDLVALELHVLTAKGQLKSVSEMLELLYGGEGGASEDEPAAWEDELFKPFHEIGQSHTRLIEHLQSLDFDWADGTSVTPVTLDFLSQLNLQSCVRPDETGCEVVDRSALVALLSSAHRVMQAGNRLVTEAHSRQLLQEMEYVLGSCVVENHRRRVLFATAGCYDSWRRLLDTTLVKCFDRIPQERREGLLFDLLHALPSSLRSPNTQDQTAATLAEATLSALTKLREDRRRHLLLRVSPTSVEASNLPAERLFSFLRSLVECILDSSRNELVRGNLYASLVNYVHLITDAEDIPTDVSPASLAQSVSSWSASVSAASDVPPAEDVARSAKLLLASNSVRILKPVTDRLVALVSRDAIDGAEVWKTVAFIVLDSLVRLSSSERQSVIVTALSRPGYLAGFVQGLKESDLRLQEVLKPDPDDLNSLYVYEAKMSLLTRMSQTRAGAERLLEARLIPILADCDFIDTRPESDQAFVDRDSFLPSAVQRYHQLLIPALQVVTGLLATLGSKHSSASHQAMEFLKAHRDTAILLLKNETEDLSLSSLEEMRLLVSLSTHVLPLIPKAELLSSSGFGGIHVAVLYLAAKALGNRHWANDIRPTCEPEIIDASAREPAYGQTKFQVKLHKKDMDLRKALVVYLGTASHFTEHEFSAVLSPAIATKYEEGASRVMAIIPSVGDAIDALSYVHDGLSQTLKQFLDFSAELASKDHAMENIPEIFNIPESVSFESLDVPQRQALINNELQRWQTDARDRAHILFQLLEMLLLLVWRHLGVYGAEDRPVDIHNLNMSIRLVPSFDVSTFRAEAGRKLGPLLHRMTTMARDTLGLGWQSYEKYMEIMSKRLRDTAGLQDASEGAESSSQLST